MKRICALLGLTACFAMLVSARPFDGIYGTGKTHFSSGVPVATASIYWSIPPPYEALTLALPRSHIEPLWGPIASQSAARRIALVSLRPASLSIVKEHPIRNRHGPVFLARGAI